MNPAASQPAAGTALRVSSVYALHEKSPKISAASAAPIDSSTLKRRAPPMAQTKVATARLRVQRSKPPGVNSDAPHTSSTTNNVFVNMYATRTSRKSVGVGGGKNQ